MTWTSLASKEVWLSRQLLTLLLLRWIVSQEVDIMLFEKHSAQWYHWITFKQTHSIRSGSQGSVNSISVQVIGVVKMWS